MLTDSKVVVIGSLNYDIIVKQQRMPAKGETVQGDDVIQGPGGKGANQAASSALLGINTYMVGKVGDDRFGQALTGSLKAFGVNVDHVLKHKITGLGLVHSMPDGDYYSTVIKGSNGSVLREDVDKVSELTKNADFLVLQDEIPAETSDYAIKKFSVEPVSIILNNAPARKISKEILAKVDWLIVNEIEAQIMADIKIDSREKAFEASDKLLKMVKSGVIITLGEHGSIAKTKDEKVFIPAKKNIHAIDTTGAGDSFIGGLISAFEQKMNLKDSMRFATEVSAITVTKNGGQASFPTLKEIQKSFSKVK